MAKRTAKSDAKPTYGATQYKPDRDGPLVLVYNARGGAYRASIAKDALAGPTPTLPHLPPLGADGEPPKPQPPTALATGGRPTIDVLTFVFAPGLNLVGKDTLAKLAQGPGFAKRVELSELIELGELDEWVEIKPNRAKDYVRTTGNAEALKAIATVETREDVAKVIERQLAEVSSDGGLRTRARRQNAAHAAGD